MHTFRIQNTKFTNFKKMILPNNNFVLSILFLLFIPEATNCLELENDLVGSPTIDCSSKSIAIRFKTKQNFEGYAYVKDHSNQTGCQVVGEGTSSDTLFTLTLDACAGLIFALSPQPEGLTVSATVTIQFSATAANPTQSKLRSFNFQCFYPIVDQIEGVNNKLVSQSNNGSAVHPIRIFPLPICRYEIFDTPVGGSRIKYATIGQAVYHRWTCEAAPESENAYCMSIYSCFADGTKASNRVSIIDQLGCVADRYVIETIQYGTDLTAVAKAYVFRFHGGSPAVHFQCQIRIRAKTPNQSSCAAVRGSCDADADQRSNNPHNNKIQDSSNDYIVQVKTDG